MNTQSCWIESRWVQNFIGMILPIGMLQTRRWKCLMGQSKEQVGLASSENGRAHIILKFCKICQSRAQNNWFLSPICNVTDSVQISTDVQARERTPQMAGTFTINWAGGQDNPIKPGMHWVIQGRGCSHWWNTVLKDSTGYAGRLTDL